MMTIPENAAKVLRELENAGFKAYLVGGCVRDALMNRAVHDYDIATNALPDQMLEVFGRYRVIPTGLKHGTITVLCGDEPFEVTSFRIDGDYSDSRRPDSVMFTSSIEEDLARRDFTINAIAMDISGSITDPYGGRIDIEKGVIRCVGEPEKRFSEDALRIMRALRFASRFGFEIESRTADAVHRLSDRLQLISKERIRDELDGLLSGRYCAGIMLDFADVLIRIIPEIKRCVGFEQFSPYHRFTVWEHIVRAVSGCGEDDLFVRRTMLFHDICKPECFKMDENGIGHFKGHAQVCAETARRIMHDLRYDNRTVSDTCELISRHSDKIQSDKQIKRLISKIGEEQFFRLIRVKRADDSAKSDFVLERRHIYDEFEETARRIIAENQCFRLSQLAVNGRDMIALGLTGAQVGNALDTLLQLVIDGGLPNEREALVNYIKEVT